MYEDFKTKKEIIKDLDEAIEFLTCYANRYSRDMQEGDDVLVKLYGKNVLEVVRYADHASIELRSAIDYLEGAKRILMVGMPKET